MGKKKVTMIFKGSLKTHWIRYITNLNINVNPTDIHGMSQSWMLLRTLGSVDSKFLQPGFQYTYNVI